MNRIVKAGCAAAVSLVLIQFNACGGGKSALPAAGQCSVSLSGGPGGRYDCTSVLFFDARASQLVLSILPATSGPLSAALTLGAQNTLHTGTLQPSSVTQASAQLSASGSWITSQHNSDPDQGTFSLDVSSAGSQVALDANTTVYAGAQGTLTLKLEPQAGSGATGEVTATVSFTSASTRPGSSPDGGAPDSGTPASTCVATLSGDFNGSVNCSAFGYYQASSNTSELSILGNVHGFALADGGTADLNVFANVHPAGTGDLQAQTFTTANTAKADSAIQVFLPGGGGSYHGNWDGNAANTLGTFSATVSEVGPSTPYTGGDKFWNSVHGTYTGTLVGNSDGGSGVTFNIKY